MELPLPPEGYPIPLRLTTVPAGTAWLRIQRCYHASALYWGRKEPGRWNDPDGDFGVLYVSETIEAAFAETFGRDLMATHAPACVKFLSCQELGERCLARLWAEQDLRLVDFTGPALALEVCQHWSRWLHGAPERPDGVIYPSRLFPGSRNLAVFERCSTHWQETPLGNLLSLPEASGQPIVYQILDDQGWGLVD